MEINLSIIMPMFNAESTILGTLISLENQTCLLFELIIIDDGSNDKSVEIVQKYIQSNNQYRIKLITQINKGPSAARNAGIEKSHLTYIMFLDSDDLYDNQMVEIMLKNIDNSQAELVCCGIEKRMKNKRTILSMDEREVSGYHNIAATVNQMQENEVFNYVWNKIYLLNKIKDNEINFPEKLSMGEDFLFNLNYVDKIKCLKIIPDALYFYETNNSFLTNKLRENDFDLRKGNIVELQKYFKKNDFKIDLTFQFIKIFYAELFNDLKRNGYFSFKKNSIKIEELFEKKEIENIRQTYKPVSISEKLLFLPIKRKNKFYAYLISLTALLVQKLDLSFLRTKSI